MSRYISASSASLASTCRFVEADVALLQDSVVGNQLPALGRTQAEDKTQAQLELTHLARSIAADHNLFARLADDIEHHIGLVQKA
jgi:hypothetical protein